MLLPSLPIRSPHPPATAICALILLLAYPATPEAQQPGAQNPQQGLQGFPQAWTGPELSADYVGRNPDGTTARTRLYFGKDKIRWDDLSSASGKSGSGSPGATVIVDYAKGTAYMIDPAKKQYMEGAELSQMMMGMMGMMRIVFQPADVNNPCLTWLMLATQQQRSSNQVACKNGGSDLVNGRSAQKWELADATSGRAQLWVDKKTHLIIRMRDDKKEDDVDVENLREGPQPASLFEVPAGYNKVDVSMGSLLSGALKGQSGAGKAAGDSSGKGVQGAVKDAGKDVAGAAAQATKDAAKESAKEKATKKVRGVFRLP